MNFDGGISAINHSSWLKFPSYTDRAVAYGMENAVTQIRKTLRVCICIKEWKMQLYWQSSDICLDIYNLNQISQWRLIEATEDSYKLDEYAYVNVLYFPSDFQLRY